MSDIAKVDQIIKSATFCGNLVIDNSVNRYCDIWYGHISELAQFFSSLESKGYKPSEYYHPGFWSDLDPNWHQFIFRDSHGNRVQVSAKAMPLKDERLSPEDLIRLVEQYEISKPLTALEGDRNDQL